MTITNIAPDIPRDRYSRPLVVPKTGGKPVPYSRCTSYVSVLDDTWNLNKWMQRMVALGLSERSDYILEINSLETPDKDDVEGQKKYKGRLNDICEKAMEHAKAHSAATVGTALHALCERVDRGMPLGTIPTEYAPDIDAYLAATRNMDHIWIEQFSVLDNLRIGGTPDRVVEIDGRRYIADIKTGDIQWGIGKIEMQLAVYAHSVGYDHTVAEPDVHGRTSQRFDLGPIDQTTAIIIHLPAGTGTCELVPVDIAYGWRSVSLATEVRTWRAHKRTPLALPWDNQDTNTVMDIPALIEMAADENAVRQLWAASQDVWLPLHTDLARQRIAALNNGSA